MAPTISKLFLPLCALSAMLALPAIAAGFDDGTLALPKDLDASKAGVALCIYVMREQHVRQSRILEMVLRQKLEDKEEVKQ